MPPKINSDQLALDTEFSTQPDAVPPSRQQTNR